MVVAINGPRISQPPGQYSKSTPAPVATTARTMTSSRSPSSRSAIASGSATRASTTRTTSIRLQTSASALVFALMHLGNVPQAGSGDAAAMLVSVGLLGLLWGGVFLLARNLWVAAAHHAAWNFTIVLSGVPLSGNDDWRALVPMQTRYAGSDWLTGGMFGPENSLLVIAAIAMAVVLVLRAAHRRGKMLPPTGLREG